MKKYLIIFIALLLILISYITLMKESDDIESNVNLSENVERNISGRTQDEYIEDFDYLFNVLEENFPFFGVSERKYGVDIRELYLETRDMLGDIPSDDVFMDTLNMYFFHPLNYVGHLGLVDRDFYHMLVSTYTHIHNQNTSSGFRVYVDMLNNPKSRAFYGEENFDFENTDKFINNENVTVEILEENEIAYIKIDSFNALNIEKDREILFNFYQEVENYEHLIFDITSNGGGASYYFDDLIVAPNIEETLAVPSYLFLMGGTNNRLFIRPRSYGFQKISKLNQDDLPYMNEDDLKKFDYFIRLEEKIEPLNEEKMFKGKIWLLVSEDNYSASERAAMFSKSSGFATLVGERTGGDGIGTDPALIVLPNTGIIIRYSHTYGTDEYGRNSEEFGTEPDIYSEEGKSALETVLGLIKEQ